jgi:hypothetical protein
MVTILTFKSHGWLIAILDKYDRGIKTHWMLQTLGRGKQGTQNSAGWRHLD